MTPSRSTLRAARTLALDVSAAQVVTALAGQRIPCLLLKGPAMVARLYGGEAEARSYTDVDLLVPPDRFAAGGEVLGTLGYRRATPASTSPLVLPYRHEEKWQSAADPAIVVDLHLGFHGVTAPERFWPAISSGATSLRVAGTEVPVPGAAGCALVVALHVWHGDVRRRPWADLDRALLVFDDSVWRGAAELAAACGALPAFAIGLGKRPAGAAVLERLGVAPATDPTVWLRATPVPEGAQWVGRLRATPGGRARRALVRRLVLPDTEFLAAWARRYPVGDPPRPPGLGTAYLLRWARFARTLPAAAAAWRASTRSATTSPWSPDGPAASGGGGRPEWGPAPGPPGRTAARPVTLRRAGLALSALPLVAWAVVARLQVHRRLPAAGLDGRLCTVPPPRSARLAPRQGDRVVRAVVARAGGSCLEEVVIRQLWLGRRGVRRDLVVGVTAPGEHFAAHAWLAGDPTGPAYVELYRRAPGVPAPPLS